MPHVPPIAFSLFDQPNSIVERYISRFYRGLHLDQRLTWQAHIKSKRQQLNLRVKKFYWLIGRTSRRSREAYVSFGSQEIPRVLWNPHYTYSADNSPPLVAVLSHINPVHALQSCLLRSILILSLY